MSTNSQVRSVKLESKSSCHNSASFVHTMLAEPILAVLGPDPANRRCRINCYAFQQDAITSFRGWQYAAFYSPLSEDAPEPLYIHVARRPYLQGGEWEVLVFNDYPQTVDDGHNTIQLGICPGDGTIHLSYDHHCDVLRYRYSTPNLALTPTDFSWSPSLFTSTLPNLPGLPSSHKPFHYVTYPRFLPLDSSLLFTLRDGKAGLGNDHLYIYSPSEGGAYEYLGQYLTGLKSNPYIHGLDYRRGKLHVTWVYRGFVHYEGWDDPNDTKHKQQAGPNGAENNHNVCYAFSEDGGRTWKNGDGKIIADLVAGKGETIDNESEGIVAVKVGKGRGLTNQEAQAVDWDGGVHVLNRNDVGEEQVFWKHYYRNPETGIWSQQGIRPIYGSTRGRLAVGREGDLYTILPDAEKKEMRILKSTKQTGYKVDEEVWVGKGLTGEPLVDSKRLEDDNVLSLMALADAEQGKGRNVVVLDFQL